MKLYHSHFYAIKIAMENKTNENYNFDYSKYDSDPGRDSPCLENREYWGIHKINDRLVIDCERYKKTCKQVGIDEFIPKKLKTSKIKFFTPSKQKRDDYSINIANDLLNEFENNWRYEFKPIFEKIKTPDDVYESNRLDAIAHTSCSDDFDEIDVEARLASIRRMHKYTEVIRELYAQFISKLATEVDRIMFVIAEKHECKKKDFSFDDFEEFSKKLIGDEKIKIKDLDEYDSFNMLRKINNFLKHNSVAAYEKLRRYYPDVVASVENKTSNIPYENAMFAADWLIIPQNYIEDTIDKIKIFFKSYCQKFIKENVDDANWDNDDYFETAFNNLKYPREYFGLNF